MVRLSSSQLARALGARLEGPEERMLAGGAPLDRAGEDQLSFLSNPRYAGQVAGSGAGAILISPASHAGLPGEVRGAPRCWLLHEDPYGAFAEALGLFKPPREDWGHGVHASAVIHPTATIGEGAVIGPHVVLEENVVVGGGSVILANCMLYRGARIGRDCRLHAGCVIREDCVLGDRVLLHDGVVIGSDGFGFAPGPDGGVKKIPQTGIVEVGDEVEMGANCTIDRATMGATRIGAGSKLDNLVHVAHNVSIGPGSMIAGQSGIAGSTTLGPGCIMGGNSAVSGHLVLGAGVQVGGHSGVTGNAAPGSRLAGFPAVKHKDFLAQSAALRKLPELRRQLKEMQKQLRLLQQEGEPE